MKHYDYLIVGGGLTGACWSYKLESGGKRCIIVEKTDHIGGMCYTECKDNIDIHVYGAHIFHTNNKDVWDFVNSIDEFIPFTLNVKANYKGQIFSLPFNMNTFYELWGITDIEEAKQMIHEGNDEGVTIEEWCLNNLHTDIYEKLIKEYTEKQWKRKCSELPAEIIKRIPIRFEWDNNYYYDKYVGIPKKGYTYFLNKLIKSPVLFNIDDITKLDITYDKIIWTGKIDEYYNYKLGHLEYRSLQFLINKYNKETK